MASSYHRQARRSQSRSAFTLIELLVVLAIIGILAALLFPAFRRAQEGGYQAACASNLQQIYQAAQLYKQDERYYPSSLAFLLPEDYELEGGPNPGGTGTFKGGRDSLICPDDDTDPSIIRSSYGDISYDGPPASSPDMGRYVWNYWGYRPTDATCTDADVSGCAGTAYQSPAEAEAETTDSSLLFNPAGAYNARSNPLKYSLSNRFAPNSTIITHCVYHRIPTASGKMSGPHEITDSSVGQGARDIILRLDGSARVLDVSAFHTNGNWSKQNW